jgi:DNA-binding transcriptional LysR family regulator
MSLWCLPNEGTLSATLIARAFREKGLAMPRAVVRTSSIQILQGMALTGRVLSFASRARLRLSGNTLSLKAIPVDLRIPYGRVGIATLKNRTIGPGTQRFIEGAREVAKLLAKQIKIELNSGR